MAWALIRIVENDTEKDMENCSKQCSCLWDYRVQGLGLYRA